MIRCVVFDFDGTLVDSNAIKRAAFFEAVHTVDPNGAYMEKVLQAPKPGDRFEVMGEQHVTEVHVQTPRCFHDHPKLAAVQPDLHYRHGTRHGYLDRLRPRDQAKKDRDEDNHQALPLESSLWLMAKRPQAST